MAFIQDNQFLILFCVVGFGWVMYKVFTYQQAGEKDRDEASFDLF